MLSGSKWYTTRRGEAVPPLGRPARRYDITLILAAQTAVFSRREHTALSTEKNSGPDFSKGGGLLPAVAQDADTGDVLMMAYMNQEAYEETLRSGRAVYFSRSRNRLWRKGEESGNVQHVRAVYIDCDADTILLKVHQIGGAACHEGYRSCFFRQVTPEGLEIVGNRVFDPAEVYGKK